MRELELDFVTTCQNLLSEMREDQTLATEPTRVLGDTRVVEMEVQARLEEAAFAHEEIGVFRLRDEVLGPAGVTGVEEGFVFNPHP